MKRTDSLIASISCTLLLLVAGSFQSPAEAGDELEPKPLVRPITREKPLVVLATGDDDLRAIRKQLPEPYKSIFVNNRILAHVTHTTGSPNYAALEEQIKKDKIIGFIYGEGRSGYYVRNLKFALRHGIYYGHLCNGLGTALLYFKNAEFYRLLKKYKDYFTLIYKSQNPSAPLDKQLAILGFWLTGRMKRWGTETEQHTPANLGKTNSYYAENGFNPPGRRPIDWMPPFVLGLAYGATSYRIEGVSGTRNVGRVRGYRDVYRIWRTDKEQFGKLWHRAIGPFFKDVVDHKLIPSRKDVLENIKVAIRLKKDQLGDDYPFSYTSTANGTPGRWYHWMPKTRAGIVPVLPPYVTEEEKDQFEAVVTTDQFDHPHEILKVINSHYDPKPSKCFAVRNGDTIVLTHNRDLYRNMPITSERRNAYFGKMRTKMQPGDYSVLAEPQYFKMKLTKGPAEYIEGTVNYRQYILGKQSEDQLFLHVNNFKEETSSITIRGNDLNVNVKPSSALVETAQQKNQVKLKLKHDHRKGVARIFVGRK